MCASDSPSRSTPARAPHAFQVMVKPIGPLCNLACTYCYYLEKHALYPAEQSWRMSDETLAAFTRQYIDAFPADVNEIEFAWQGGEPTLLGLEFFRRALAMQAEYLPPGKRACNALQTNGVLLDDAWCAFLRAHDFLVGVSIDGPADLHDTFRQDRSGRPTFQQVLRGVRCLQKHGVAVNALTAVHRANGDYPRRVYTFLRDAGFRFIQFIPIVQPTGRAVAPDQDPDTVVRECSVRPRQWGDFLCKVFDAWFHADVGRVFVQIFDQALAAWLGQEPTLCSFARQCGRAPVLEHNGDLYACDHFVDPAHRLGNIRDTPLAALVQDPRQAEFGRDKETRLPGQCRRCEVRFACRGECPKNRVLSAADGSPGLNYLCEGYRRFFEHIDRPMRSMAAALRAGLPAASAAPAPPRPRRRP